MKLQAVASAPNAAPAGLSDDPEKSLLDSLVGLAGERALILGLDIEIMCGLIQRGCRTVTEVEPNDRPDPGSVDLIIAPSVGTVEAALRAITQAQRGLLRHGRVVVRTALHPSAQLRHAIPAFLRQHGFKVCDIRGRTDRLTFVAVRMGA